MIKYARARSGKGMAEKLAAEVMAAAKGEGNAVKKTRRRAQNGRSQPCLRTLPRPLSRQACRPYRRNLPHPRLSGNANPAVSVFLGQKIATAKFNFPNIPPND
jgi:Ribosomal protein S7